MRYRAQSIEFVTFTLNLGSHSRPAASVTARRFSRAISRRKLPRHPLTQDDLPLSTTLSHLAARRATCAASPLAQERPSLQRFRLQPYLGFPGPLLLHV